jgi:hypothetical protein
VVFLPSTRHLRRAKDLIDARYRYEDLKSRGVEFTQEPTEQPYGIDAGFRDVSGDHLRMAQQPQQ